MPPLLSVGSGVRADGDVRPTGGELPVVGLAGRDSLTAASALSMSSDHDLAAVGLMRLTSGSASSAS